MFPKSHPTIVFDVDDGTGGGVPDAAGGSPDVGGQGRAGITNDYVSRAEYEKLQGEQQRYREKWQPIERIFSQLDDSDAQVFLSLADLHARDPEAAAQAAAQAWGLTAAEGREIADAAAGEGAGGLTEERLAQILDQKFEERDAAAANARSVEEWKDRYRTQAREFGYNPDAPKGTKEERAYQDLIAVAMNETNGDLVEAARIRFADLEEISRSAVDATIEKKGSGVRPVQAGEAPSGRPDIKDFKAAKAAMMGYLDSV